MSDIVCKSCGLLNDARKEVGKGPHAFQLVCNGCGRHIKWLPSEKPKVALKDSDPMPWGKYKGTLIGLVPADYLLWLYDNKPDFQIEVKLYIIDNLQVLRQQVFNAR